MSGILRNAVARVTARYVLLQLGLLILVALLFAAWLHIPESGVIAVAASALLAAVILSLAFCGEALLLCRLVGPARRVLPGAAALLLATALWFVWSTWLNHFAESGFIVRVTGYANSRLPDSLRGVSNFVDLFRFFDGAWFSLKWLAAGMLLAIAVPFAQSSRPIRAGLRVLSSLSYWISCTVGAILATLTTKALIVWTPGHGLRMEVISLALRLGVVAVANTVVGCFVLAVATVIVVRWESLHAILGGTPEVSQPRSVDIP